MRQRRCADCFAKFLHGDKAVSYTDLVGAGLQAVMRVGSGRSLSAYACSRVKRILAP